MTNIFFIERLILDIVEENFHPSTEIRGELFGRSQIAKTIKILNVITPFSNTSIKMTISVNYSTFIYSRVRWQVVTHGNTSEIFNFIDRFESSSSNLNHKLNLIWMLFSGQHKDRSHCYQLSYGQHRFIESLAS